MPAFLFADNARSTLAAAIGPTATTITVAPGDGAKFPSPGANQQFALTLNDNSTHLQYEVVYCTSRTGDVLTVVRGQEGTSPASWDIGDLCWNGPTAGQMSALVQIIHMTDSSISPVFGATVVNGTFYAVGPSTLTGVHNTGSETIDGGLTVAGSMTVGVNVIITGTESVGGSLSVGAGIAANGNITSISGALSAALGAFGSGDGSRATLLNDFNLLALESGYVVLPNGWILQWQPVDASASPSGITRTDVDLPVTFPHNNLSTKVSYRGEFPPDAGQNPGISSSPNGTNQSSVWVGATTAVPPLGLTLWSLGN